MKIESSPTNQFAVCLNNEGYEASLEVGKIYRVIPDETAEINSLIRVIDESGEDYAFSVPKLPSYQRFIEWISSKLLPFCVYLKHCCGQCTSISFVDSTALKVGHNRRISRHKVFKNPTQRGKTSVDCFFGFKLHLVVNERGELLNVILTTGNVDDRKPITELLANIFGTVFADWGYVSAKLATQLLEDFGIHFFAKPCRNTNSPKSDYRSLIPLNPP